MSRTTKPTMLALTLLLASAALADDKQNLMKLQGKWKAIEGQEKGMVMSIDGNNFSLKLEDQEFKGTFTIDNSKTPHAMDLTVTGGAGDEVAKFKGKTSNAIYEVDGETFKWCANEPGKEGRPTKFDDKGGGDIDALNLVFERVKE